TALIPTLLFVISIIRSPLTSTLFPYTTLFRSIVTKIIFQAWLLDAHLIVDGGHAGDDLFTRVAQSRVIGLRPPRHRIDERRGGGDRKSTRLNSSHQIISYAVFCLKKKTHKHNT